MGSASSNASLYRRRRRRTLLPLLFAWPLVVTMGLWLNRLTGSHAPAATLPMIWVLVVAFVIERMHASHA